MKVLGVDPGSRITGYGIVESQGHCVKLIEAGIIKPRSADPLEERIQKIYRNLADIIATYQPEVLVLEKLYTHFQYRTTASVLGHVRGAICLLAAEKNMILAENSVKRIRKALTGNGAATKDQTQAMVAHILRIDQQRLTKDASDALALAIGHLSLSTDQR
ncbi:MAG TPA: crossover junction endodeoxyribonuclease RuvC [Candidatus Omnitrophota bacterium]|nr:crossover junction endodeoxyribonuclease RuvC [Candidatus Omnitrophota bacterium]